VDRLSRAQLATLLPIVNPGQYKDVGFGQRWVPLCSLGFTYEDGQLAFKHPCMVSKTEPTAPGKSRVSLVDSGRFAPVKYGVPAEKQQRQMLLRAWIVIGNLKRLDRESNDSDQIGDYF
jgi:hypothetical protein